jgi:PAS domain S-box-containing protein
MLNAHSWRPLLAAFVVFLLSALAAATLIWHAEQHDRREERARVLNLAADYANGLQHSVGHDLSAGDTFTRLAAVSLSQLARQGYAYELWGANPETGQKQVIVASSTAAPVEPVEQTVQAPNASWTLRVAPVRGWGNPLELALDAALGLVFSLLLAYVTKLLLDLRSHKLGLEALVEARTAELRAREARYRELFEANPQPMWVYDLETLMFLDVNDAAVAHYGYSREAFRAMSMLDIRPPEDIPRFMLRLAEVRNSDVRDAGLWRHRRKDGTLIEVEVSAHTLEFGGRPAQIVHISDVTERRRAETALARRHDLYNLLSQTNQAIIRMDRWEELFPVICRNAVENGHFRFAWVGMIDALTQRVMPVAHYGEDAGYVSAVRVSAESHAAIGRGPLGQALRAGAHVVSNDFLNDPAAAPWHEAARRAGVGAAAMFPIREREAVLGAICLYAAEPGYFTGDLLSTLDEMALDVSFGLTVYAREAERKDRDQDLQRFRMAMDATEDAIYVVDRARMRFIDVNAGASAMLGLTREQIFELGPEGVLSLPRDDLARIYDAVIAGGGATASVDMLRTRSDGTQAWIEVRRHAKQSHAGWTIVTVARDITERKRAEAALHDSEARFRSLTEMSSDFFWESDAEHRLTARASADKKLSTVSVFRKGAQIGERRWEIPYLSPDEAGWQAHRALLDAHLPFRNFELSRLGVDGGERHIAISGDPVFDAAGDFMGYRGVGADVTERRRQEEELRRLNEELERRVAERTKALEVANTELEAFSYSVSHDLRAPLRAIQGFSRLVEQQYASQIDEQGRDMLRRVGAGAQKMGLLIDDLLNLSRISRQAMRVGPVDLSALARELADELHTAEPERGVEWIIAPQVSAEGDPGLLRVLLQNLIGNAWKYSSRRDDARIEFGVSEQDGRPAYFVRDNGAGFDMAYAQKLFGAFQRLHSTTEFPGLGIGLATVARILHRHGGRAWAEGRVGEGATFYFSLG